MGSGTTPPCSPRLKKLVKFAMAADTRLSPAAKCFTSREACNRTPAPRVKLPLGGDVKPPATRLSATAQCFTSQRSFATTPAPRAKTSLGSDVNNSPFSVPKVKSPLGDDGPADYPCDQDPAEEEECDTEDYTSLVDNPGEDSVPPLSVLAPLCDRDPGEEDKLDMGGYMAPVDDSGGAILATTESETPCTTIT